LTLKRFDMMENIPDKFIKINLSLLFLNNKKNIDAVENGALKMMVRDFYVFFVKRPDQSKWIRYEFYCRKEDEAQIAYYLGIYLQTLLDYQTKEKIELAIHSVPTGFPDCLRISTKNIKEA